MKVSVIIPYNKDRGYLKDAIQSYHNQKYQNKELIIVQRERTLGYNVNEGVRRAKGDYIKILAEDDLMFDNCLTDLVKGIQGHDFSYANALNMVYGANDYMHESRNFNGMAPDFILKSMISRNEIHGGTILYKRSLWEELGGWDEEITTAEEYEYSLRMLWHEKEGNYVNKTVCIYRIWDQGKASMKHGDLKRKEYINEIKNRYK